MSQYFSEQGCFQSTERMGVESLAKLLRRQSPPHLPPPPTTFCLCWSLLRIAFPQQVECSGHPGTSADTEQGQSHAFV